METTKVIEEYVAKYNNKYWGFFGYHDSHFYDSGDFGTIETAKI